MQYFRIKLSPEELTLLYHGFLCRLTIHEITQALNDQRQQKGLKPISVAVTQDRIIGLKQLGLTRLEPDQLLHLAAEHCPSLLSVFTRSRERLQATLPLASDIKEHLGQELIDQAYGQIQDLEALKAEVQPESFDQVEDFK